MREHTLNGPSSLSRRAVCPGSLAVEAELATAKESFDQDAESGSRCHKAMEHAILRKERVELTNEEHKKCLFAWQALTFVLQGDKINDDGKTTKAGGVVYVEQRFERLPYSIGDQDEVGTIDLGINYQDHFLLMDWKFGGSFVPHPRWNYQFKGYALGIWEEFGVKPIHVACVQPDAMSSYQVVPEVYEIEDRFRFQREIDTIMERCHRSPTLHVGKGCQFCKGAKFMSCPKYREAMGLFAAIPGAWGPVMAGDDQLAKARLLTAAKAAEKGAKRLIAAAKDGILETGEEIPGYSATPTTTGNLRLATRAEYPSWPNDVKEVSCEESDI